MIEKMKELEGALRLAEQKFDDKNDDFERLKRDLVKVPYYVLMQPLTQLPNSCHKYVIYTVEQGL